MGWSMTLVRGVDSEVILFDDAEVRSILGVLDRAAREVLFGRAEEKGFWRVVAAQEAVRAAETMRATLPSATLPGTAQPGQAKGLQRKFARLKSFARAGRGRNSDLWIGVG